MHKCGGALDREDVDGRAHGDDLGLVIRAGRPQLAADADLPAVVGDFLDDLRGAPA